MRETRNLPPTPAWSTGLSVDGPLRTVLGVLETNPTRGADPPGKDRVWHHSRPEADSQNNPKRNPNTSSGRRGPGSRQLSRPVLFCSQADCGSASVDARGRSLRGRIGAHSLHARRDMRPHLNRARARFLERFEREVDPEGVLSDAERARRAGHAKKAYFMRLALKSAQARAKRRRGHKRAAHPD